MLALLLVGFTVLVVAVAATTDPEPDPAGSGSPAPPSPSTEPSQEPTPEPVTMTAEVVAYQPGPLDDEGEDYTSVRVTVRNEGDGEVAVNPLFFSAVDTDGGKHGVELLAGAEQIDTVDLAPGQSVSGVVTFEGDLDLNYVTFEPWAQGEVARAHL